MNRNQQKQWFILLATIFFILISLDHCQTLTRLMVATADFLQSRAVLHLLWWLALLLLILAWANRYVPMGKIKENFDTWLKNRFFQSERPIQVMMAGSVSLVLLLAVTVMVGVLVFYGKLTPKIWETGAFWTLAVLFVSSPVAFVVWHFRDENQSKDINLKEFQKISEWVTGAHFQEEKHSEKFSGSLPENADTAQPSERSREYYRPAASAQALHTFSKQDGAVGLQIAAVYNLLPFYRGDYGQAFEKPSVHLLHSAWKVLQHDILQKLDKADDDKTRKDLINQLHQRADSPLGQAITRVLLACDHNKKPLLHRHLEILRGICLSGMDFNLAGLETEILRDTLFCGQNLTGAQWQGVRGICQWNLSKAEFHDVNLSSSMLYGVNLSSTWLKEVNLSNAVLDFADLSSAKLQRTNLSSSDLNNANLSSARLGEANLSNAVLTNTNLSGAILDRTSLFNAKYTTTEQLLATSTLDASLIDINSFSRYTQPEKQKLQAKGLIVLYLGSDTVNESLYFQQKTGEKVSSHYPAARIPFPIDLEKTRENNPDWEISIK